jgi:hypothetical protein
MGDFSIPVLPTGRYSLVVEKPGFSKLEQKGLNVTVGSTVTLSLTLQVGATTTSVEVTGEAPAVDTSQTSETTRFGLLSYHGMSGVYNNFTIEGNDDNQALFSRSARSHARRQRHQR